MLAAIFSRNALDFQIKPDLSSLVFDPSRNKAALPGVERRRFNLDYFTDRIQHFRLPILKIFEDFVRVHLNWLSISPVPKRG